MYLALFTYVSLRAIHLELVKDLDIRIMLSWIYQPNRSSKHLKCPWHENFYQNEKLQGFQKSYFQSYWKGAFFPFGGSKPKILALKMERSLGTKLCKEQELIFDNSNRTYWFAPFYMQDFRTNMWYFAKKSHQSSGCDLIKEINSDEKEMVLTLFIDRTKISHCGSSSR